VCDVAPEADQKGVTERKTNTSFVRGLGSLQVSVPGAFFVWMLNL